MDSLYVIIPAYNESENIYSVIEQWYPIVEKCDGGGKSRLVIINDGSKDDTEEKLKDAARNRPLLIPVTKENGGHGPAVIYGYRYAIEQGADYIFQTDSDGQTSPDEFSQMWDVRNEYDAQFGNRVKRGDGEDRAFVEKTLCRILKHYFGVKLPDANAPFRLMSRSFLEQHIDRIPRDYNLPNAMLTTFAAYYGNKYRFVPISFEARNAGENSIDMKKIIGIGTAALGDFRKFKAQMQKDS